MSIRRTKRLINREYRRDFRCWCYGAGRRDPIRVRLRRIERTSAMENRLRALGVNVETYAGRTE